MDATYRADLRELNELNFARYEAKLDQFDARVDAKLAEMRVELAGLRSELLKWMFLFWVTTLGALIAFRG